MAIREHILHSLQLPATIVRSYVADLTDAELLIRPMPEMNHIAWQWGHLIASEHLHMEQLALRPMPALPVGFAEQHSKENAISDSPDDFCTGQEYSRHMETQRQGTLDILVTLDDDQLLAPAPTSIEYLGPTIGSVFSGEAIHWIMHAGQWVAVRRLLGKPPLF